MSKRSRDKGARGERELVNLLKDHLGESAACRNLSQTRDGGCDIGGDIADNFAIEVKSTHAPRFGQWFEQARAQAAAHQIPVVAWKPTGRPWQFYVVLDEADFLEYVRESM